MSDLAGQQLITQGLSRGWHVCGRVGWEMRGAWDPPGSSLSRHEMTIVWTRVGFRDVLVCHAGNCGRDGVFVSSW